RLPPRRARARRAACARRAGASPWRRTPRSAPGPASMRRGQVPRPRAAGDLPRVPPTALGVLRDARGPAAPSLLARHLPLLPRPRRGRVRPADDEPAPGPLGPSRRRHDGHLPRRAAPALDPPGDLRLIFAPSHHQATLPDLTPIAQVL